MREKTRDLIVGLTVLVGLVLLGAMIVIFRELPASLRLGYYDVKVSFSHAGGVTPGADVYMAGKRVGRVAEVDFANQRNPREGVLFMLTIDRDVRIPGDVNVYIEKGFVGGTSIDLRLDGRAPGSERKDPKTGEKLAWLPTDHVATIEGAREPPAGPTQVIPPELIQDARTTMGSVRRLAETLNAFFAAPDPAPAGTVAPGQPAAATQPVRPANIHATMAKLDAALDAVNQVLADKENQANLKAAFAGMKTAVAATEEAMNDVKSLAANAKQALGNVSQAAGKTSKKFQDVAAALVVQADRLGNVLTTLQRAAAKVESGDGSAGKLLNDPALYNSLVDATTGLKGAAESLQELLEYWRENGVKIRLK